MNVGNYAGFLRLIGQRVVKTSGGYWHEAAPFTYLSFPLDALRHPGSGEIADLWKLPRVAAIRYPTEGDARGYPSYRVACADKNYDFPSLSSRIRTYTRRGMENCTIQPLMFDYLAEAGLNPYASTLIRQGRNVPTNIRHSWQRYCRSASATPGFEAWGALVKRDLAAYVVGCSIDDCYHIFILKSSQEYLKYYPNHALVFAVTQLLLQRSDVREVSYGLEPLQPELDGLSRFKLGMGYKQCPIQQRVMIRPSIRPFLMMNRRLVSLLLRKCPTNENLRKLDGLIRFSEYAEK